MTITHRARAKSENFSYEGYGSSADAARRALVAGFERHSQEFELQPDWVDEMSASIALIPIAAGASTFENFELKPVGMALVTTDKQEAIAWRAFCEFHHPDFDWGYVDGFGATEQLARDALAAGLDAVMVANAETRARKTALIEEAEAYPVRNGAAYRGGLVQTDGEPLPDARA